MSDIIADLELKVSSSAKGSTDAIDKLNESLSGLKDTLSNFGTYTSTFDGLAGGLTNLKTAINGLSGKKLGEIANGLEQIKTAAKDINAAFSTLSTSFVMAPDTSGLTLLIDSLKTLASIDVSGNMARLISALAKLASITVPDGLGWKIATLGESVRDFHDAVAGSGDLNKDVIALTDALARMKKLDLTPVAQTLPLLTDAVVDFLKTIQAAGGVDQALAAFISGLAQLTAASAKAKGGLAQLNLTASQTPTHTNKAHKGYNNLYMMLIKFRTLLWALRTAWRALSSSISDASSLTEVGNVVGTVYSDNARQQLEDLSHDAIKNYGMSELAFKQMASRFQAMGTAMGISNEAVAGAEENLKKWNITNKATGDVYGVMTGQMSDMSMTLTELAADIGSFYDTSVEDVQTALTAVYTGQTRPLTLAA